MVLGFDLVAALTLALATMTMGVRRSLKFIVPSVRYYEQSAADFYAPQFTGKPEFYSADYRLAKLSSLTYGLKVVWKASDRVQASIGYDRYSMQGRDGGWGIGTHGVTDREDAKHFAFAATVRFMAHDDHR